MHLLDTENALSNVSIVFYGNTYGYGVMELIKPSREPIISEVEWDLEFKSD